MKKIYILLLSVFVIYSCKNDSAPAANQETEAPQETASLATLPLPNWAKAANIYEVNLRQYTQEGTFNAFSKNLPRLKRMGVDILWFMPIFPISDTKKKGSLGSYYAVTDFRATNPEFGTMEDFDYMVARAHAMGMKVIIDWVPNHTGWDHVWIAQHPEYFTQNDKGEIVDPINPETGESWGWTDVADLNYDNQDMRKQMLDDMMFWVTDHAIDGFRMDVAHGVPNDFWKTFTETAIATNDSLFLLGETEKIDQANEGYFHMIYGWEMHHMMNEIAKGEKNVNDLDSLLKAKHNELEEGIFMQFITNHDENSWSGTAKERLGDGVDVFTVLAYTYDGMPLVYGGQEEPLDKRLEFFEKHVIPFKNYKKEKLIRALLELKHRNKALWNGEFGGTLERVADSEHVYAFTREKDGDKVAVIVNLSDERREVVLTKPIFGMTEIFTGKATEMGEGTRKRLDAWEYWVASNR